MMILDLWWLLVSSSPAFTAIKSNSRASMKENLILPQKIDGFSARTLIGGVAIWQPFLYAD